MRSSGSRRRRPFGGVACFIAALCLLGAAVPAAWAGASDPIWTYAPEPPPEPPFIPPPAGALSDPCGLTVDGSGNFYLADHYHHVVDHFTPNHTYIGQLSGLETLDGPCGLAVGSAGQLYVNEYHRSVREYGPPPGFSPGPVLSGAGTDSAHPTGVAVDPASGRVYVDERTYVGVYDSAGAPVEEGGVPLRLGAGNLEDGYGIAVSAYPGTAGYVYVPDAATDTVKVYDPSAPDKVETIAGPPGGFSSLREAAVAVDRVTGEVYVLDDLQPEATESPHALVEIFSSSGAYEGHLKYEVVDGAPSGLAVDNSAEPTQRRVYVTSGASEADGVYAYPPGAATTAPPVPSTFPPPPPGASSIFATVPVGGAAESGEGILCEGDACQVLPPEPVDPTLTTLLEGPGNPKVRYVHYKHRKAKGHHHHHRKTPHKRGRAARPPLASASGVEPGPSTTATAAGSGPATDSAATAAAAVPAGAPLAAATPATPGLEAHVWADGGAAATQAGSHPYALRLGFGLDQSGGEADLRNVRLELPPGLLLDPVAADFCTAAKLATPRSSPFEASASGESCPQRSQVGTIEVRSGTHEPRSFGLFELEASEGTAARLGAAPFGVPLVFDAHLGEGEEGGAHLTLQTNDVPQSLALHGLALILWGAPWDTSHNIERGNCLNEAEPSFAWAKCSPGDSTDNVPLALLTLPTQCGAPLAFTAAAESWGGGTFSGEAVNRDSAGQPAPITGCEKLNFEPRVNGVFSVKKASSASGFAFRLTNENPGLFNPRLRSASQARVAAVHLPSGVTLNPSLGAGLEVCSEAQIAAETPTGAPGSGCPSGSKIGDFSLRFPFYKGILEGAIYLAEPYRNRYGSLLAVYLVAKSAQRGIIIRASGKLIPSLDDGTITATFEGLPQLPYTDLEVNFRSGQRAPLVSPPACGQAVARIELLPWAQGAPTRLEETESPIETGIEDGPCPTGSAPPFGPGAVAGGVNSNIGSYTPYFVHIKRRDTEQEITSYSLVLPKGITGKLAGIPFCPDADIEAARHNSGVAETASPSCPTASQVGRTVTGYGVGSALTYSPGRIFLAGPYHGAPLSLVTIDAATIGPFDLGTIVVRSAFDLDPRTAQLQIDSRASDPIPHLIDGIPLHLRDIRVYVDRPEFTHNPSSCEPSQLESTLTGSGPPYTNPHQSAATATSHFQLLNCLTLGFHPKLGLRLLGGVHRGAYPGLRASFVSRGPKDSNLKDIAVVIPRQMFVAQEHIRSICTRPQFTAERCPADSVYGHAAAFTPLFDKPLTGNVYLRADPARALPDLVADLHSGSIRIIVEGGIGSAGNGGVLAQFVDLPDAPINRFNMVLYGGKRGLFRNSADICRTPPVASLKALGQNNIGAIFTSTLRGRCKGRGKNGKGKKHGRRVRS